MNKEQIKPFQILRGSRQPLYMQVVDHFRQYLRAGVWAPNDVLPSLDQLTHDLGVARVTIRDAIKILADEGLLIAARGRGTIVTEKARGHRPLKLETNLERLSASLQHDRPDFSNIEEGIEMPVVGPDLGLLAPSYNYIKRVHVRDTLRYCVIRLYLDSDLFNRAPERFRRELAVPVLNELADADIIWVNQLVRFGKCDEETSQMLKYPAGDPVAHIRRVLRNQADRILYYADVTYRADILEIDTEEHRD
ncbi:GntR family transcriptional regulator [Devosia rhodophyticola]|uniref:GntR family transcriptional regulator n=1 Tax=Devosia rhodophyticola TaxID=3026423 RepID=A0ABY7YV77_9HYPH|nr:GntR family transcriptional regulator [Devosia rhodophyticola]WDR05268.1 GntR family transcriptional regulator [Devosia rhodophyticola]